MRSWANNPYEAYFWWKFYESIEGLLKVCHGDINLHLTILHFDSLNQNSPAGPSLGRLPGPSPAF